ncbi:hypothetical protein J4H92_09815 [Leucobacter weissii]|uniref:Uncharacterized protein n=1 Tax=Leucobacter weissii TaxID=1983706 RepID=A0A939MPJ3_9MICO|nr:hypothetical protein [Leucobacter weissii]MBO1902241.1 hypothetical protein [Leucobacter weissii]
MNEVKNTGGLDFPYVLGGFAAYDPLTYLQLSMIVAGIEMAGIEPDWDEVLANSGIGPKKDLARALVEDGIEASITDFISKDETLPAWMRNKPIHLKGSALGVVPSEVVNAI